MSPRHLGSVPISIVPTIDAAALEANLRPALASSLRQIADAIEAGEVSILPSSSTDLVESISGEVVRRVERPEIEPGPAPSPVFDSIAAASPASPYYMEPTPSA